MTLPLVSRYQARTDIIASEGFADKLMRNLALDHNLLEGGPNPEGGVGSAENLVLKQGGAFSFCALAAVAVAMDWPRTKAVDGATCAAAARAFDLVNAGLFERLAGGCGAEAIAALRTPLEETVAATHERQRQCVAAEALAGLLRADAPAVRAASEEWMEVLLRRALAAAAPESLDVWAACVRYAGKSQHKERKGRTRRDAQEKWSAVCRLSSCFVSIWVQVSRFKSMAHRSYFKPVLNAATSSEGIELRLDQHVVKLVFPIKDAPQ